MEVSDELHASATLPPGKEPLGTHWIGDRVGSRAVLDAVVKRKIPSPRREVFGVAFVIIILFEEMLSFVHMNCH
jgi:hypothetical protein